MTSQGGIFLVFQWERGKNCEIGQNRPRNGQKSDFLAIFGLWEALKTPYRCDLKLKLVELLMGHNLKAFRAKKIWPGWQGGVRNGHFWPKYGFSGLPGPLNHVFFKTGASGFPVLPRHVRDRLRCSADSRRKELRFEGCWSNEGLTVHEIEAISRGDLFNSNLGEIVT